MWEDVHSLRANTAPRYVRDFASADFGVCWVQGETPVETEGQLHFQTHAPTNWDFADREVQSL